MGREGDDDTEGWLVWSSKSPIPFGHARTDRIRMRYPDTTASIDDFRRANWQAAVGSSGKDGYPAIWQSLSAAARGAIEDGRHSEGKVMWLLADACSMLLDPSSVNKPFKPFLVTSSGRSAISDDFQGADVELLAQISDEVTDPWIQGRSADLVWLLRKPRSPRYALLAIDAYRKIPVDTDR